MDFLKNSLIDWFVIDGENWKGIGIHLNTDLDRVIDTLIWYGPHHPHLEQTNCSSGLESLIYFGNYPVNRCIGGFYYYSFSIMNHNSSGWGSDMALRTRDWGQREAWKEVVVRWDGVIKRVLISYKLIWSWDYVMNLKIKWKDRFQVTISLNSRRCWTNVVDKVLQIDFNWVQMRKSLFIAIYHNSWMSQFMVIGFVYREISWLTHQSNPVPTSSTI